jgi:hypothetical protein
MPPKKCTPKSGRNITAIARKLLILNCEQAMKIKAIFTMIYTSISSILFFLLLW